MSDVYEALAAPVRRAILDELHQKNGQTLFELCTRLTMKHGLGMSRQAISQHLDVLEAAGLVVTKREGKYKFHFADFRPLREIVERWPAGRPEPGAGVAEGDAAQGAAARGGTADGDVTKSATARNGTADGDAAGAPGRSGTAEKRAGSGEGNGQA